MVARPFRFGVSLLNVGSRSAWHSRVREAESLGYDVLQVPDHLGTAAPFPSLVSAAEVSNLRVGTYVLNGGIANPAYLARDVVDVHRLTNGRLELGLGTGYVEAEFAAYGVPFGTGGERLRKLEALLAGLRPLLAAEPDQPAPPIMLSGAGDKMLKLGGREADIFSFSIMAGLTPGMAPEEAFAERVAKLGDAAGDRDVELNLFVAAVGDAVEKVDLSIIRNASGLSDEQLVQLPGVLVGAPDEIADRLQRYREQWNVNYISVLEPHMAAFAEVIKHLR
ncbi:TIGR03621 family F420-dependent LLM class oxidoreductase [Kribbella sp. NPDC051770]|uniref:TIGR03621 family F420-dependent LLM class oxidoreductase n=1 Tax=Kribbella sp. NPDC051770 TaxID=3155413 RepID=UPI0034230980